VSQLVVVQRGIGYELETLTSDLRKDSSHFATWEFTHISSAGVGKYFAHLVNIHACRSLAKILRDYRPDLVHIHTISEASPAVLFLLKKTPTVMTVHGPEEDLLCDLV
jgi:Glycosyltransferase Family 4